MYIKCADTETILLADIVGIEPMRSRSKHLNFYFYKNIQQTITGGYRNLLCMSDGLMALKSTCNLFLPVDYILPLL